ncbi:MAG: hypothetical protein MR016_09130 [Agathobacter sp.]|nr:hypothetical protein [Agathobacter sp.]
MRGNEEEFKKALQGKNVPILVLDQKWHRLFAIHGKPQNVVELESSLNALLARQGKLNTELKSLKKLKAQLMDNIVLNMQETENREQNSVRDQKLEADRKMIDETNGRIESIEDELLEIPKQIRAVNESLMLASMDYFYEKLRINKEESDEIDAWIKQIRIDLKKNIIRKQNRDINSHEMYAYIHDVLGPEVLDLFDAEYGTTDK